MESLERVRVGIIGCGRIAGLHALGYLDHPRAEIVAVCDRDADAARRAQAEWGAARRYRDYATLLADADVNAVEILLPHHLHREVAIAALQAGKHVSLQKPPTLTLRRARRRSHEAALAAGRRLRVFENFMYYPPHVKARELVPRRAPSASRSRCASRPRPAASTTAGRCRRPRSPGGWIRETCGGGPTCFDHGYHCFNMGRFFIAEPVERVHAWIHVNRFGADALYDGPALFVSWKYAGVPKFGSWEVIASIGMRVRSKYYAERRPHRDPRQRGHHLGQPLHRRTCSTSRRWCSTATARRAPGTTSRATGPRASAGGTHEFIDALHRRPPTRAGRGRGRRDAALRHRRARLGLRAARGAARRGRDRTLAPRLPGVD